MSTWGQFNLMDPSSLIQAEMILFHDHALMIILGIFTLVSLMGFLLLFSKFSTRSVHEAQTLEIMWTVLPAFLLVILALPSLRLLYLLDEHPLTGHNILKVIGKQWYWSYESPALSNIPFDSYMTPEGSLNPGEFRLLEVDKRAVLPYDVDSLVLSTSSDVIHSWALPSMGVKMDSVPGRLNSAAINPKQLGVFYGQCSEICGANHAFMPIVVEVVPTDVYLNMYFN